MRAYGNTIIVVVLLFQLVINVLGLLPQPPPAPGEELNFPIDPNGYYPSDPTQIIEMRGEIPEVVSADGLLNDVGSANE